MIKVNILNETGHTELAVETFDDVLREIEEKGLDENKFNFVDGKFCDDLRKWEGNRNEVQEITITDNLIGG